MSDRPTVWMSCTTIGAMSPTARCDFWLQLDLFKIVEFRPLSKNQSLAELNGISRAEALTDLYGIDRSGRSYKGYDLYSLLAGRIFLLLPLWPVLVIGRIAGGIGPWVYRYVAAHRTAWSASAKSPRGIRQNVPAGQQAASNGPHEPVSCHCPRLRPHVPDHVRRIRRAATRGALRALVQQDRRKCRRRSSEWLRSPSD